MKVFYPELNELTSVLDLDGEEWKDVVTHVGHYKVSNFGRVKRLKTSRVNSNQATSWVQYYPDKIMRANNNTSGYPQVGLKFGGERAARTHRLVGEAFLPEPSDAIKEECRIAGVTTIPINHIDGNRLNSHLDNLEWCTPQFNCDWCVAIGNHNTETTKGDKNFNAVLTEDKVWEIIALLKEGKLSQEKIGEMYGVKQITISNIWNGRSWAWLTGIPRKGRALRKREGIALSEK